MDRSASSTPEPDAASRRRSGRVVKAPTKYAPDPAAPAAAKRKRGDQDGDEHEEDELDSDEEMSGEDDASDEDHPAPKPRKASSRAAKPSSKKPKINGTQPTALGHGARIPSRPKKTVRIDAAEKGSGLFGMSNII